jgi:hypothetical protein
MLILFAAATVAAAPAPAPETAASWTPNLYSRAVPAHCRDARHRVVDRYGRPVLRRLGDLPAVGPMLLVDRRINGCPVITMMRGVPPPPDNPDPPPSAYQLMPIRPDKH